MVNVKKSNFKVGGISVCTLSSKLYRHFRSFAPRYMNRLLPLGCTLGSLGSHNILLCTLQHNVPSLRAWRWCILSWAYSLNFVLHTMYISETLGSLIISELSEPWHRWSGTLIPVANSEQNSSWPFKMLIYIMLNFSSFSCNVKVSNCSIISIDMTRQYVFGICYMNYECPSCQQY